MTKALFDTCQQRTNPNAFSGQFMSFDKEFFDGVAEGFQPEPNGWVSIEDSMENSTDGNHLIAEDDGGPDFEEIYARSEETEEHFWRMATEAGLDARWYNHYNNEDQQEIIAAWIRHMYGEFIHVDHNLEQSINTTSIFVNEAEETVDYSSLMMSEAEEAAWYEMNWDSDFEAEPKTPSFYGQNRTNRGALDWNAVDWKGHKTWMNCRRGKGPQRAPSWQKEVGGRRKARNGQIVDTPYQ
jgi:hypothetical protein